MVFHLNCPVRQAVNNATALTANTVIPVTTATIQALTLIRIRRSGHLLSE